MLGGGGNLCTFTGMGRHWAAIKDDKRSLPASFNQSASISGDLKRLHTDSILVLELGMLELTGTVTLLQSNLLVQETRTQKVKTYVQGHPAD